MSKEAEGLSMKSQLKFCEKLLLVTFHSLSTREMEEDKPGGTSMFDKAEVSIRPLLSPINT